MSAVEPRDDAGGPTVLPPKAALRLARPVPSDEDMAIDGLTDDEWNAFEEALADR